jgi:transcriptional regulator with XRE-family HTH domain
MAKKGDLGNIEELEFENENQKNVAILVAKILLQTGLSQKEFADKIQVSLATFTNILRPYYKKVPTVNLIRKISEQTENPEDTYNALMNAAKHDLQKYPYKYGTQNNETAERELGPFFLERENQRLLIRSISSFITNNNLNAAILVDEYLETRKEQKRRYIEKEDILSADFYRYNLIADFRSSSDDLPIDYWVFSIISKDLFVESSIRILFFNILLDSTERIKYSIVVTHEKIYEELISYLVFSALNMYVSVILLKSDAMIEKYIDTAKDHRDLDEVGLSINP